MICLIIGILPRILPRGLQNGKLLAEFIMLNKNFIISDLYKVLYRKIGLYRYIQAEEFARCSQ
jgi:hypothetical protein